MHTSERSGTRKGVNARDVHPGLRVASRCPGQPGAAGVSAGAPLVVAACVSWAADNNLTRKVSTNDAMVIACLKGRVVGSLNLTSHFLRVRITWRWQDGGRHGDRLRRLWREPGPVCRRAT
jgi:hypothetical protein